MALTGAHCLSELAADRNVRAPGMRPGLRGLPQLLNEHFGVTAALVVFLPAGRSQVVGAALGKAALLWTRSRIPGPTLLLSEIAAGRNARAPGMPPSLRGLLQLLKEHFGATAALVVFLLAGRAKSSGLPSAKPPFYRQRAEFRDRPFYFRKLLRAGMPARRGCPRVCGAYFSFLRSTLELRLLWSYFSWRAGPSRRGYPRQNRPFIDNEQNSGTDPFTHNVQHQRWEPAAADTGIGSELNGWLPSAECCGSARMSPEPPPRLAIWYLGPLSSRSANPLLRDSVETYLRTGGMVNKLQQLRREPKRLGSPLEMDV